ncbi:YciI family protein [Agromyces humatus]|nr:YciI family protein [Agromyces humatus]
MTDALPNWGDTYLYTLRPTRVAMLTDGPTDRENAAAAAHWVRLESEHAAGQVVFAGRTLVNDERNFAAIVFKAGSLEEARAFAEADPAVVAGVFRPEVYRFEAMLG